MKNSIFASALLTMIALPQVSFADLECRSLNPVNTLTDADMYAEVLIEDSVVPNRVSYRGPAYTGLQKLLSSLKRETIWAPDGSAINYYVSKFPQTAQSFELSVSEVEDREGKVLAFLNYRDGRPIHILAQLICRKKS